MEILRSSLMGLLICSFAAATEAPPMTDAQAAFVFEHDKAGGEYVPGYDLAVKLGVPTSIADPYQVHYFARAFTGEDGAEHAFGRSEETGDYLIVVQTKTLISYIHADKEFKFVGGAYYRYMVADPPQPISPEEAARALLGHELTLWAARVPTK